MRVIREPRLCALRRKSLHLDAYAPRPRPTLYNLHRNTPIQILKRADPRPRRPTTGPHPYGTRSHMPAPVCKRPQSLRRYDLLLVVRDAYEFGIRCSPLYTDPVKIRRDVRFCDGVVYFQGPVQAFACAVGAVECGCPGALEIAVFGLPDGVFGVDWGGGGAGVGTMKTCLAELLVSGKRRPTVL